jgi:hypothetical protein
VDNQNGQLLETLQGIRRIYDAPLDQIAGELLSISAILSALCVVGYASLECWRLDLCSLWFELHAGTGVHKTLLDCARS